MDSTNLVLLCGTVSAEPLVRTLPSGANVTQLELSTLVDGRTVSTPVALHNTPATVGIDDEVVVTGYINKRFYRAGGVTQARTEVIAHAVIKRSRCKAVERAIAELAAAVAGAS